jgi:hypothetical protein
MTFERLSTEGAILSDAPTAVLALQELIAQTGATEILCWMNMGSIPHAAVLRSMERFAATVMPALTAATSSA